SPMGFFGSSTGSPQKIINGQAVTWDGYSGYGIAHGVAPRSQFQRYFPTLNAYWPKHRWRLKWTWLTGKFRRVRKRPAWSWSEEWTGEPGAGEHHLPGMYRRDYGDHFYTRQCVAVTENLSRNIYYWTLRPAPVLQRLWETVSYRMWKRWSMYTNFSTQDFRAVAPQRYDTPEHLSPTDIHQVYWRRLVLQARGTMQPEEAEALPQTEPEKLSVKLSPKSAPKS